MVGTGEEKTADGVAVKKVEESYALMFQRNVDKHVGGSKCSKLWLAYTI